MEMKKGIFYGVGIGPGDPELLTLKARRILDETQVIATPQTASGQTLALDIAAQAVDMTDKTVLNLHFPMSRDEEVLHAAHGQATSEIEGYLASGRDVAMLNLGDVSIFATYSYLMEILRDRGYETVMIPGVPSFCAVAARLGVSLTTVNAPLHIYPAGSAEEGLDLPGTKVLMKSGKQLPKVRKALENHGLLAGSAMVSNCGLPGEQVFPDLSQFRPEQEAGYFATIIVKEET